MTKRLIIEANNVQTLVDLDETELQAYNDRQAELEAEKQAEETAKQVKETAQASGNQKLLDLGLSQAEATALTGYTPPSED